MACRKNNIYFNDPTFVSFLASHPGSITKQQIYNIKREVLALIEDLLERNISKKWFLENCSKLSQTDYSDVVEERSLDNLCGYPICDSLIKKAAKQKYHISRNKIYDITDRKNFCSNKCYKASNFLKNQLHNLPLYMRKVDDDTAITPQLLSDADNCGSFGEEVVFEDSIKEKDIEAEKVETVVTANLNNILQEDIKDCTEHLSGLSIKENVYKEKYVFNEETQDNEAVYSDISDCAITDDEEEENLYLQYDNVEVLSNKQMPVPRKNKKAVMIDPLKAKKVSNLNTIKLPVDNISKIFLDWFTEDTMKYLLGEKQVYSVKADQLFKKLVDSENPEHLNSIKEEYVNICCKIDKLPDEDGSFAPENPRNEKRLSKSCQDKLEFQAYEECMELQSRKKRAWRRKQEIANKKKSVKFAADVKAENNNADLNDLLDDSTSSSKPEPTLPLVDSLSQHTLRKQVLVGKLKNVYLDILPTVDLHYRDIQPEVKALIDTFSLTPTNIMHKPKQMRCIAVVLFRILTETKMKTMNNYSVFSKLYEDSLPALNISREEIENLVFDLVNPEQLLKLYEV